MNLSRGGVPERPKGADCKSAVIDFEGSIRAQRESVAVGNDPKGEARSAESSFPHHHHDLQKASNLHSTSVCHNSTHVGKDEKLRLRFDSSESERTLPQATTRRAKRAALSHPSPPPLLHKAPISNQSALPRILTPQADFTPWRHSLLAILSILLPGNLFRLL